MQQMHGIGAQRKNSAVIPGRGHTASHIRQSVPSDMGDIVTYVEPTSGLSFEYSTASSFSLDSEVLPSQRAKRVKDRRTAVKSGAVIVATAHIRFEQPRQPRLVIRS